MCSEGYRYMTAQVALACLDTMHGDYAEYSQCFRFAVRDSSVETVDQMHGMHGALTFARREPYWTVE